MEDKIGPRECGAVVPLTALQSQFWQHAKSKQGMSARAVFVAVRIRGPLKIDALRASLQAVERRHEALRTTIVESDGESYQLVGESKEIDFDVVDLRGTERAEAEMARLVERFIKEEVSLSVGPLFASRVFRSSVCEHVLVCALDHIISDGASLQVLHQDTWALYRKSVNGDSLSLSLSFGVADSIW